MSTDGPANPEDHADVDPTPSPDDEGGRELAAHEVHRLLRDAILTGRLSPGMPVSQVQLASEFHISRTPLREATRMLEREGLLQSRPHKRMIVAPLSAHDLDELYACSIVMQTLGLAVIVPKISESQVGDLRECLAEMNKHAAAFDVAAWEKPHRRFHQLLVRHAGERITTMTSQLSDHSERYRRMYLSEPGAWSPAAAQHTAIVEACERGDTREAVNQLAHHLARTALTLLATSFPTFEPVHVRTALRLHGFEEEAPPS